MNSRMTIDGQQRSLSAWNEADVLHAFARRAAVQSGVCITMDLETSCGPVRFASGACARGGGVARELNRCEKHLLDLWIKHGLGNVVINGHAVNGFLKEASRWLN